MLVANMLGVKLVMILVVYICSKNVIVASKDTDAIDVVEQPDTGDGCDPAKERLDTLEYRFLELFVHVKELGKVMLKNQQTIEANQKRTNQLVQSSFKKITDRIDELERQHYEKKVVDRIDDLEIAVAENVSLVADYAKQILDLQSICANHDVILRELDHLKPNCARSKLSIISSFTEKISIEEISRPLTAEKSSTEEPPKPTSCNETCSKTEMETFGRGWLVFQQRVNGSIDFYRDWAAYRDGFGVVGEEFWLGLNALHRITSQGSCELVVELKDYSNNYKYARYSEFKIGSEAEKFVLEKIGKFTGTAGDSLTYHLGMKFTTFDSDNDESSSNCAVNCYGAWWYKSCYHSNINGEYTEKKGDPTAMFWYGSPNIKAKSTKMMIRLK